jgi:hypothetical protein
MVSMHQTTPLLHYLLDFQVFVVFAQQRVDKELLCMYVALRLCDFIGYMPKRYVYFDMT